MEAKGIGLQTKWLDFRGNICSIRPNTWIAPILSVRVLFSNDNGVNDHIFGHIVLDQTE